MIIGVVGPLCSGKDSFAQIMSGFGFEVFSFGDVLREEMKKQNIDITRENLQNFSNDLRRNRGAGAVSKIIISRMQPGKNYLVQGFRNPAEVKEFLALENFDLVSLDSSAERRFERMKLRKREKDPETFKDFRELEDKELLGVGQDEFGFHIQDCMNLASMGIVNEGNFEDLRKSAKGLLDALSEKYGKI